MKNKTKVLTSVKKPEDMRTKNVHATAWKNPEGTACAKVYAELASAAEMAKLANWMDKAREWQEYTLKLARVSA